jgi:hypothetical protein
MTLKGSIIMNRSTTVIDSSGDLLVEAACQGLMSGASRHADAGENSLADKWGVDAWYLSSAATHDCKGKNDCKGQGGCSSSDKGCKGKNSCKGKGGCKTSGGKKKSH